MRYLSFGYEVDEVLQLTTAAFVNAEDALSTHRQREQVQMRFILRVAADRHHTTLSTHHGCY